MAEDADLLGILRPEDWLHDPCDPLLEAPGARSPYAAPHEVDGAPLPRGAQEDLRYRPLQALMGIARDQLDAFCAPRTYLLGEPFPGAVRLRVDDREAQDVPPAVRIAPYGRDDGRG